MWICHEAQTKNLICSADTIYIKHDSFKKFYFISANKDV